MTESFALSSSAAFVFELLCPEDGVGLRFASPGIMLVYLPTNFGLLLGYEIGNGCSFSGEINQLTAIEHFPQMNHYCHIYNKKGLIPHFIALHIIENRPKEKMIDKDWLGADLIFDLMATICRVFPMQISLL